MNPAFNIYPEIFFLWNSLLTTLTSDLKIIYYYWQNLRGERLARTWRELDMLQNPFKPLPSSMVKDVKHDRSNFR